MRILFWETKATNTYTYTEIYCSKNSVAFYIFRPPIVATFKGVFFEGHIKLNVKTIYNYNLLSYK
jgi:hypothetical protein